MLCSEYLLCHTTPDTPCPGEPCHTLSQYAADQDFKRLPANTKMEFLPGDHTLNQTVSVRNLTWLSFHGDSSSLPEITSRIVCTRPAGFVFTDITELLISTLDLISCGHDDTAAVVVGSVQQSNISHCGFYNSTNDDVGGALHILNSTALLTAITFQNMTAENYNGVLCIEHSNLLIINNTFQNNLGGALYVESSTLNLATSMFQNNFNVYGGALTAMSSSLILTGNTFQNNSAAVGGALHIEACTLSLASNTFQNNIVVDAFVTVRYGGALYVLSSTLNLTGNTFWNNSAMFGGALYVQSSTLNLATNTFHNNSAGNSGGALYVKNGTLNFTGNTFQTNSADFGGAIFVEKSTLSIARNAFQNNAARSYGGALFYEDKSILTRSTFQNNSAENAGGTLNVKESSNLTLSGSTFQNNSAPYGGAVYVQSITHNLFTGNTFQNNSAHTGGALHVQLSSFLTVIETTFQHNSAEYGGALGVQYSSNLTLIGTIFQHNSAAFGGALYMQSSKSIIITGNTFEYHYGVTEGGALFVTDSSTLNLTGNTLQHNSATDLGGMVKIDGSTVTATNNKFTWGSAEVGGIITATNNSCVRMKEENVIGKSTAQYGGGITALDSQLEFAGNTMFENNTASYGGGLYVHNTVITGKVTLANNSGAEGGGGVYASNSTFYFKGNTTIVNNTAVDGGGLLLSGQSQFYLQPNTHVYFISNSAKSTGGAIKVEERNPLTYCIHSYSDTRCFFQIKHHSDHWNFLRPSAIKRIINKLNVRIYFDNNSAIEAGADLHGGSVDNCTITNIETLSYDCSYCATSGNVFDDVAITIGKIAPGISSDPLQICTCGDDLTDCTGSYHHPEPVYPGGTLEIAVIAHGQRNGTTPAIIQVVDTSNSSIILPQNDNIQNANNSCTTLKYTIQSFVENTTQNMTLYAEGPCKPTQANILTVTLDIHNCPPGFQLLKNQSVCNCAERLQHFTDTCVIDNKTVLRRQDAEFWLGYDSKAHGLILHPHCPLDYCTSEQIYLAVNDSDKQCTYNRSGLLCGRCSANLSLALGSSRCLQCSNSYISLLAAFVFAGFALVVLLLGLRLTVAAGTINGLIFYANVITVNSAVLFQPQVTNVLTVFVAWLNLDLGIETCFYDGMDAYVKVWLQFAFPMYVWTLVCMIIIGSHYSGRVAKVFGSNPVAVLATLFLLSYAKMLRTCIAILSYTYLEYPNNSHIAVWLYDGNIRYLSGKHIPLFVAAMVCLIFLFLPYTMLLTFSQWLQVKSRLKIFSCINSRYIKPFLDAYHAPYSKNCRYWTGLMLLLRFVLFLISAVNALGDSNVNLLAITSATTLILPTILGSRIYKTWSIGLLETSFIINLTILASATLYIRHTGGNQNAATFTSVGIAFVTFTGIAIYHAIQQIKGTRLWRRVWLQHNYLRVPLNDVDSEPESPPDSVFVSRSAPTKTVVDIREPCMATD